MSATLVPLLKQMESLPPAWGHCSRIRSTSHRSRPPEPNERSPSSPWAGRAVLFSTLLPWRHVTHCDDVLGTKVGQLMLPEKKWRISEEISGQSHGTKTIAPQK